MGEKNIFKVFNSFLNLKINKNLMNVVLIIIIFININFSYSTDLEVDKIINEFEMYLKI